jgi:flagellar basal body-associated protein FliL
MAREIKKKVISDDLLFGDDFDETKLSQIEDGFDKNSLSGTPGGGRKSSATAGKASELPGTDGEPSVSAPAPELDEEGLSKAPSATPSEDASQQQQTVARMVRSKMLLLFAALSVVVVIAAGLTYLLWPHSKPQELPAAETVRHPIVIPSYTFATNFLLFMNASGKKKDLLKVDVEMDFWSLQAYEQFKNKQIYYNDIIYKFLRKQEPPENSFQNWGKILERDLFEILKNNYPETRLNAVAMKGFQRL